MNDSRNLNPPAEDNVPATGDAPKSKPKKTLLTYLLIPIALAVMAPIELAKALMSSVYGKSGNRDEVQQGFGSLASVAAGILVGYLLGWSMEFSTFGWLSSGIATAVLTYIYAYPAAWLGVIKPAGRLSETLWEAVPTGRGADSWFTDFLKFGARVAVLATAAYIGYGQLTGTYANLHGNGWPVVFAGAGAALWGGFCGVMVAVFAWYFLTTSLIGIAVSSGALLTFGLMPYTQRVLESYGWSGKPIMFGALALEFAVYLAYLFPLIHVTASHGLRFVKDFLKNVYTSAYDKKVGVYDGVFGQLANIFTAYIAGAYALVALALAGVTVGGYWLWVVPGVVSAISYLLVGEVFKNAGNKSVGLVTSLAAGGFTAAWSLGAGHHIALTVVLGGVAVALTFYTLYPIAYVLVRLVGQFLLNNSIAEKLVTLHTTVIDGTERLLKELALARRTTYNDTTWFSAFFARVLNVAALVPVFIYATSFLTAGGMTWSYYPLLVIALLTSYIGIGKLLLWARNEAAGAAAGLTASIAGGILIHAAQPWGLWASIPGGVLVGVLTYLLVFPVAYVVLRAVVNGVDHLVPVFSKVVDRVLDGVYTFTYDRAAGLITQFRTTYRELRAWFKPIRDSIAESWKNAWQSVRETWESITKK